MRVRDGDDDIMYSDDGQLIVIGGSEQILRTMPANTGDPNQVKQEKLSQDLNDVWLLVIDKHLRYLDYETSVVKALRDIMERTTHEPTRMRAVQTLQALASHGTCS